VIFGAFVAPRTAQPASRYALTAALVDRGTVDISHYEPMLGVDRAIYDGMVAALQSDRYGYLAAGAPGLLGRNATPELIEWAMSIALQAAPQAQIGCLRAFSETDFRPDLPAVTVPTLIVYGTADSPIVPIDARRPVLPAAGWKSMTARHMPCS
jgi:pimeloyl-ACP methyl ester carboxylesterase